MHARTRKRKKVRKLKRMLGVAAVVADIVTQLTGCVSGTIDLDNDWGDWDHSGQAEVAVRFFTTVPLGGQTTLSLVGGNGAIRITGVPGSSKIVVDALRRVRSDSRADAQGALSNLHVSVKENPEKIEIKTVQPESSYGRTYIVDYEITVPSYLIVGVVNGNGTVRIEGIQADVDVANGNGDVSLVDQVGSSWVNLGNGELSTWAWVPPGGQIAHAVGNGRIFLSVQNDVSASFEAAVGTGTISMTGLELQEVVATARRLKGVLGAGEGQIGLQLGNGQIRVEGEGGG